MGNSLMGRQGERMTAQHVWPGEPVPVPRTCACMSSRNRWNLQRFPAHASEREIEDGWPYQRPPPCIRDGLEMLEDVGTLRRLGQAASKRKCSIGPVHCSSVG
jgi:hypothetical protein